MRNGSANRFNCLTCGDQLIVEPIEKSASPVLKLGKLLALEKLAVEIALDPDTPCGPVMNGIGESLCCAPPRGFRIDVQRQLELGLVIGLQATGEQSQEEN